MRHGQFDESPGKAGPGPRSEFAADPGIVLWSNRSMRERNLLYLFLALNVALAGAFIAYLVLSTSGQPEIVATTFPSPSKSNPAVTNPVVAVAPKPSEVKTNPPVATVASVDTNAPASMPANPKESTLV